MEHTQTLIDTETGDYISRPTALPNIKMGELKGKIIGYFKKRAEPRVGPRNGTFNELNVRDLEPIAPQDSPDPVRQGDTPSRPARMPKAIFTTIKYNHSIDFPEFSFPLFAPEHRARVLADGTAGSGGRQQAWNERSNVDRPRAVPYGTFDSLPGTAPVSDIDPVYSKLAT